MHETTLHIAGKAWRVDTDAPVELAIPLDFSGEQPRAFSLPPAGAETVEAGGFVGDTRRGGAVNCETVTVTPHGNTTHTEGVGHISQERIFVGDVEVAPLVPAVVLCVGTRRLGDVDEQYRGEFDEDDEVICRAELEKVLAATGVNDAFLQAVIIAVDDERVGGVVDYSGTNPPYLTDEAVGWLREVGCDHLLVELPSVDRESDGGTVPNHHQFFDVTQGETPGEESRQRTITEMIQVPRHLEDGPVALSLRFARFRSDAAASRPVVYGVSPKGPSVTS